jgi:hypothetical protein
MKRLENKRINWEINQNMIVKNHLLEYDKLFIKHAKCQAELSSLHLDFNQCTQILLVANHHSSTRKEAIKQYEIMALDARFLFKLLKMIKK